MIARRGSAKKKHEARLEWLRARPLRWFTLPGINEDVDDEARARIDAVRIEMLAADLLGKSSGLDTQRETIRRLVSDLRGKSVEIGW